MIRLFAEQRDWVIGEGLNWFRRCRYPISCLIWIFPILLLVFFSLAVIKNVTSGGMGLGFDDISYICIFKDFIDGKTVVSPYTTPKLLPVLLLGGFYHITHSLRAVALLQGVVGFLFLVELFKLGRRLGLHAFFSACALSVILMFHLEEVATGNATIWATWFFLLALNRSLERHALPDLLGAIFVLMACLTRPEPTIAVAVALGFLIAMMFLKRLKLSPVSFIFLAGPPTLAFLLQLIFDKALFNNWVYSADQVRNFAKVQIIGAYFFPAFSTWDLPQRLLQLPAALDAGPLLNQGVVLHFLTLHLIACGFMRSEKATPAAKGVLLLLFVSTLLSSVVYKVLGIVLYPRFFIMLSIAIAVWICFGLEYLFLEKPLTNSEIGNIYPAKVIVGGLLFFSLWFYGIKTVYASISLYAEQTDRTQMYAQLCQEVDAMFPKHSYRMIGSFKSSLLGLILDSSPSAFVPIGWMPFLSETVASSRIGKIPLTEDLKQSILSAVGDLSIILTDRKAPDTETLLSFMSKGDYLLYENRGPFGVWLKKDLSTQLVNREIR